MTGSILRVVGEKGFGFIRGEDQRDYFFHRSDLHGFFEDLVEDLRTGQRIQVTFESVPSQKGLRAGSVQRVDGM